MVQRRYTKKLCGLATVPYSERLRRLQLCSLELWRLHFDLHMCYRIIFGLVNVCDFLELNSTSQTRGHPYKLFKPCTYKSMYRTVSLLTIDFSTFASFKRKQVDFTLFLLCYHVWLKHNSYLYHSLTHCCAWPARAVATSTMSDPVPMTTASRLCTRDPLPPVVSRSSLADQVDASSRGHGICPARGWHSAGGRRQTCPSICILYIIIILIITLFLGYCQCLLGLIIQFTVFLYLLCTC